MQRQDQEELANELCFLRMLEGTDIALAEQQHYLQLLDKGHSTRMERLKLLKGFRAVILADLHIRQKALDDLDYVIYLLRQDKGKETTK